MTDSVPLSPQGPPGSEGLPGPQGPAVSEWAGQAMEMWRGREPPDSPTPRGLGTRRVGFSYILLFGNRVLEESEAPRGALVRRVTR